MPEALSAMTAEISGVPVCVLMKTISLPAPARSVPLLIVCATEEPKSTPPVLIVLVPALRFSVWAVAAFMRMVPTPVPAVAVKPVVTSALPVAPTAVKFAAEAAVV